QVGDQIRAAGHDPAAGVAPTLSNRLIERGRPQQDEVGHRLAHDALRFSASRARRRRSTKASSTLSGVTGSASRSTPMASATALTSAGGKPDSAPSPASLAPNGP